MRLAKARVHFIGIGGIGMCGLAELLRNMGGVVTGSDMAENAQTQRLRTMGIEIKIGQRAENVEGAEVVVYSSAIKQDNPEFKEARRQKIPLIPRAEALAEMMRLKRGVAVGGSHGKTTTTSMTAAIFLQAKVEPTIVVGGGLLPIAEISYVPAAAFQLKTGCRQLFGKRRSTAGGANRQRIGADFLQYILGVATGRAFIGVDRHG